MLSFAPRLTPRLLEAIARCEDPALPIAEISRRVGAEAERLGLFRPSYERVRSLVAELRYRRALKARQPSTAEVLLDVALRVRPTEALLDHMAGEWLPPLGRGP
ncbi:MAG: hypothetical protein ICV67_06390 [Thermoleophilia bacterium]|nr:hypothetical protein [Thermoleophilia bacterium]